MIRLTFLACAAIVAFSLACSGGDSASPTVSSPQSETPDALAPAACTPSRAGASGEASVTITSGGADRTYILHIPPSYTGGEAVPLVLLFHGFAMGDRLMADVTQFGALADGEGFIVASLQGLGEPPAWGGIPPLTGTSDVPFVRDVLTKLETDLCIDTDRVFAVGYSNGGGMVQLLTCEMGDQIAAVGVVSGLYTNCPAKAPIIAFHGTKDPIVPFDGGDIVASPQDDNLPPIRRSLSDWATSLGCDGLAVITHASPSVELSTYRNCAAGDGEALLYTIIGGGHTWPGAAIELPANLVGTTTHDIDATAMMWQFFVAHPHVR